MIGRQNFHNGGVGIVGEEEAGKICSNAISSYIAENNASLRFIYYSIARKEYYEGVESLIGGTGQKELSKSLFASLPISLPLLAEQERIASFFGKLDELIETEETLLRQYEEQKCYLLRKMFV